LTTKTSTSPKTSLARRVDLRESSKADTAAMHLAQQIVGRELAIGDCLASENELSAHYGASRPNVRQALQRLAAAGLVETRHGVGTFVSASERWNLFDPLILDAFVQSSNLAGIAQELIELRIMVEVECVGMAAERISAGELKELELWLKRMEAALGDIERITRADIMFHDVIIAASHNRFLQGIMNYLTALLSRARFLTMEAGGNEGQGRALESHREIYRALLANDKAAARAAMSRHMRQLEEDMQKALAAL